MVERFAVNEDVGGPSPPGGAKSLRSLEAVLQFKEFKYAVKAIVDSLKGYHGFGGIAVNDFYSYKQLRDF